VITSVSLATQCMHDILLQYQIVHKVQKNENSHKDEKEYLNNK